MKPKYTLYYHNFLVDSDMTEEELIQDLLDLEVDFSYSADGEQIIINDNRYYYEID